jgi:hypothetical protein
MFTPDRTLTSDTSYHQYMTAPEPNVNKIELFQFLRTLSRLRSLSLDFGVFYSTFNVSHIPALMEAIRNTPLRQLFIKINVESAPGSVITPGLTGLDTLCVRWDVEATSIKPDSAFDHLYALISPSLASLSRLELYVYCDWKKTKSEFDIASLKGAGEAMRIFLYEIDTPSADAKLIRTVAEVFPKLTKLTLLELAIWTVCIAFQIDD